MSKDALALLGAVLVTLSLLLALLGLPATGGDLSPSTTRGFYFLLAAVPTDALGLGLMWLARRSGATFAAWMGWVYALGWLALVAAILLFVLLMYLRVFVS